jgi:hypothetical protein
MILGFFLMAEKGVQIQEIEFVIVRDLGPVIVLQESGYFVSIFFEHAAQNIFGFLPSMDVSRARYPIVTLQLLHLNSVMHLSWYGLPSTVMPLLVSVNFKLQTGQNFSVMDLLFK